MTTIKLGDKKITIRELQKSDIKIAKRFQEFLNSLVKENAKISHNALISAKEEEKYIESMLTAIRKRKRVTLLAEYGDSIIGVTSIEQLRGRMNHVGDYGIMVRKEYRGIGLGKILTRDIIKLAKSQLKPKPRIIKLGVFTDNIPAIALYKKYGFKKVAKVPKQLQYNGKLVDEAVMILEL